MPASAFTHTPQDPGGPPATAASGLLGGRLRDSLWVGWTFTLLFGWVAFLWIGFRARNARWLAWGLAYSLPFIAMTALSDSDELYASPAGDAAVAAVLLGGAASIVHAFVVRRRYVGRRRAGSARSPSGRPHSRYGRGIGIVGLYFTVALVAGGAVLLAGLVADPCLPFCVAPSGYVRTQIVDAIAIAGAMLYLALVVPLVWLWGTRRVWLVPAGGAAIGALALAATIVAIGSTGDPTFCHC